MEEKFISGYCRLLDASRTVTAECEDGRWVCDCAWPGCEHAQSCPIARQLGELAEQ